MIGLLALALVQPPPAQDDAAADPIVVTGTRLEDDRAALEQCLRRNCPPLEDVAASLRYAENLFVSGAYRDARSVLAESIRRNARHGRDHPGPVSGLYRAHANVSVHMGEGASYKSSTFRMARTLREGLPDESVEVMLGRLEVGDMHVSLGEGDPAQRVYQTVWQEARQRGQSRIAALASLRLAWLYHLRGERRRALGSLDELIAEHDDEPVIRLAAAVLATRIAPSDGDGSRMDALIAEASRGGGQAELVLIHSPPLDLEVPERDFAPGEPRLRMPRIASEGYADRWVDIGFWVRPDGTVEDVEILRSSGRVGWADQIVSSIGGRRYAPWGPDPTAPGQYRVERFSYTSLWEPPATAGGVRVGSRIRQRSGVPRIERIDLTAPPADQAPPAPATPE
jgi:hypothetical protein